MTSSASVSTVAWRHFAAKKTVIAMVPSTPPHQNQLAEMPYCATQPEMTRGVSEAKVVATREPPIHHQRAVRPPAKKPVSDSGALPGGTAPGGGMGMRRKRHPTARQTSR